MSQRIIGLLACASLVFLSGCASTGGRYAPLESRPQPSLAAAQDVLPSDSPDTDAATSGEHAIGEASEGDKAVRLGSGSFINRDLASRGPAGAGATGEVTFNFEGESLHAVVKAILGDFLQENYVIAPGVQGTVTFSTAKPLRGDQALSILEMLLRWNNATAVWQDGRYTILPVSQALPGNLTPRTGPAASARGYEVRAVPLQYISAVEMEKLLKPYAKPEGIINVDPARNMLVLAGTAAELANYQQTVEIFDVDWLAGMSVGTYRLEQAEAAKVVTELEKVFGEGAGTPLSGMFRFIALEGVNSIIVITPQPKYLAQVQEWIERLDAGGTQSGSRLYVYDVKNVKATDLAGTLGEIFGGQPRQPRASQSGAVAPGLDPVRASTLGRGEQPRFDNNAQPAAVDANPVAFSGSGGASGGSGIPGATGISGPVVDAAGGIALGSEENVRVSAIEENNQLLVKATSQQWESIRRVIERLDQIPLQVHIEAKVVEVSLTDQLRYGVSWFLENAITNEGLRSVAAGRNSFSSIAGSIARASADAPLQTSWTFVGRDAVATIAMLDSVSRTQVISAPSLMVLNNKSATINVGAQVPVQSVSIGGLPGTGTGVGTTNSFTQFLQTGTTLTVTPRVNPGGLVFMEIEQDDSTPVFADGAANPTVNNKTVSTEVAIQSGETLILGGLISEEGGRTKAGLPFLSRIPLLGGLFGEQSRTSNRRELIVLITPRVVSNPEDARRVTDQYMRQFRGMQPLRVINDTPAAQP
ncbi:type II secretion system secretin GspD [Aquimonas voraii]|uniref:General secretion pathway protein D n=1 Tax=Aquimonas voraii TaxID=265719 RepID=A0A1G6ZG77_9GAMM|nr:type II secretion system secretin GspD [Aquimonas voraii]SDE00855.1 general secretion pathway protein D [Aquimonas voraii]